MSASSSQKSLKRPLDSDRGSTVRTSKTSPYSGQYQQALEDAGVHMKTRATKPANWQGLQERMAQSRESLSPSRFNDADFEEFTEACERAMNEPKAMAQIIPMIVGKTDKHHLSMADVLFNQVAPFDKGIAFAKPDLYCGAAPGTIDRRVRVDLHDQIIPSKNTHYPAVPNFFLEVKGDDGSAYVAKKQACHNGAIGARAMHSLQHYGADEAIYDGNAYSFTSSFHNGTLHMYTTHPTAPKAAEGQTEYHMTQVKAFAMTSDRETFQKGATHYRNARDLAATQRDNFIKQANKVASQLPADTTSSSHISSHASTSVSLVAGDSDTSVDELSAAPVKRPRRRQHSRDKDGTTSPPAGQRRAA